jgi:CubicO group peptidase (beta-lactamase class C family)
MHVSGADHLQGAVDAVLAAGPPGAHRSLAVTGGPRWDACAGRAQVFDEAGPHPVPLTEHHAHDLGSVTKIAGTTAMLAALVSAGKVTVDDEIGRYLAHLPSPLASCTVRDLLTHRAGLWEWWPTYVPPAGRADHAWGGVLPDGDPIRTVAALPLRYPPRTGRHYSDLGFMLLGRVIETVTGAALPAAHRDLVGEPFGATGLHYAAPPAGSPAAASTLGDRIERGMISTGRPYPVTVDRAGFDRWGTRVLVGEVNDGNAFHSFAGAAGHAGLFGTADALHALGAALLSSLDGSGPWPALPSFLEPGPDPGQLLGFREWRSEVDGCSAAVIGHPGFPGIGFGVMPRHAASILLATNRLHVHGEPMAFDPLWQGALAAAARWQFGRQTYPPAGRVLNLGAHRPRRER